MTWKLVQGSVDPVYLVDAATGTPFGLPGAPSGITITDAWEVVQLQDMALNDSDKYFTVPAGYEYQILIIYANVTTSATVGNRRFSVTIWDADGHEMLMVRAGATQAASLTYRYTFAPSLGDQTAVVGTTYPTLTTPIPPSIILPAGYQIGVTDYEAIDVTADDMLLHMLIARRTV